MKRAIAVKLGFIAIIGIFIVGFIYYFHRISEDYFMKSNEILFKLNSLKRNEDKLNYQLLYSSIYLYKSSDDLVFTLKVQKELINTLAKSKFFKDYYPKSYEEFKVYKKYFKEKEELIFEYLRFLMPIKNSIIFISNSIPYLELKHRHSRYKILQIVTKLILLQRSSDLSILDNISIKEISSLLVNNNSYNRAFIQNLKLLVNYYPKQAKILKKALLSKSSEKLKEIFNTFLKDTNKNVIYFQNIMIVIVLIISLLFLALLVLVYKLEINLSKITQLATHDYLTGLKNRIQYEEDLKKLKKPVLILFDIDKFKNINDYFGSAVGDEILKAFAKELNKFVHMIHYNFEVYRFGSDEFGLVGDSLEKDRLKLLASEFIKQIELKSILEDKVDLRISVSAGISTVAPYLENADIALKEAKSDLKKKIVIFEDWLNEKIKNNLQKANEIKYAIEHNGIVPFFQGIFDKDKNIYKYEVLSRVKVGDELKSIYPYLEVIKENKMYHKITLKILEESLKVLNRSNIHLSINLSLEDVIDEEVRDYILEHFNGEIAKKTTFEILESEISQYDILEEFIKALKKRGVKFAIDDFGSGYSNFARVLKLQVDYIKIDGSIIKHIDSDKASRSILKTILSFAKENNLKTVAEFVHNEEVFNIAKEMGVDYFQGFFLAEPKPFEEL